MFIWLKEKQSSRASLIYQNGEVEELQVIKHGIIQYYKSRQSGVDTMGKILDEYSYRR